MLVKAQRAARLAVIISMWCWCLVAVHGMWSFGVVLHFFDGGTIPLYPASPVTYGSFFTYSIGAAILPFFAILILCILTPDRWAMGVAIAAWCIGAIQGARDLTFVYQLDFGTTWQAYDALRELFFHPVFTPFVVVLGLAGTVAMTRRATAAAPV